jgi:iron(III) transport system substrate-binding protein
MRHGKWTRRDLLKASGAASLLFAGPAKAAAPPAAEVTPALIEAAKKEGKLSFYSALELNTAERLARTFERNIRGSPCGWSVPARSGFSSASRRSRAAASRPSTSPTRPIPAHYLEWKKNDWLAPYLPADVARHFPADQIDPDGMYATSCAWTEAIGYNTNLVKREDAPKSYADLLDPKWQGKMVKAHPGYSGAILTATFRAGARSRLAVSGKARAAEDHAGAIGRRSAEEDPARRACRDGRRQ